jgi:hypothetical protein
MGSNAFAYFIMRYVLDKPSKNSKHNAHHNNVFIIEDIKVDNMQHFVHINNMYDTFKMEYMETR